jgi:general secretion pathway protein D
VTTSVNIGGIQQPVIGQRKIEHEIRLKEGEINLLGGILEDQQTKSLSGIPGLAQIPILRYLFSQTSTDRRENEIVFALVPHIVRAHEVSSLNQEVLDVGTANAIELRRFTHPAGAGGAAVPPAGAPQGPPPAAPVQAPPSSTPPGGQAAPPTAPGNASFLFDPPGITQAKGATFAVNILLSGAQNVYSVPVQLNYDPNILQMVNVSNGGFLSQDGQAVALVHRDDPSSGMVQITATRPPGSGGVSGQGAVLTLTFLAKASGQTTLAITRGGARDPAMQAIPVNGAQATINIQ